MSYRGPHRAIVEARRREDGRYTGALLECGHEIVYERTQAEKAEHSVCSQCKGMGPGKKWRANGKVPGASRTPDPGQPEGAPTIARSSGGDGLPAPTGTVPPPAAARSLEERVADLERAVHRLVVGVRPAAETPAEASPEKSKAYTAEGLDLPDVNFDAGAVPAKPDAAVSFEEIQKRKLQAELVAGVRKAVVALARTHRTQVLEPVEFNAAVEEVLRAAQVAGWLDPDRAAPATLRTADGGRRTADGGRRTAGTTGGRRSAGDPAKHGGTLPAGDSRSQRGPTIRALADRLLGKDRAAAALAPHGDEVKR